VKCSSYRLRAFVVALAWCLTLAVSLSAAPVSKDRDKEKEREGKPVDAGSFGIYQNGNRVGTETFSIYQTGSGSTIQADFKTENVTNPATQTSTMLIGNNGDLKRYEWKELSPGSAELVVVPNDDFLTQKWRTGSQEKEHEQPYLMPVSTTILDDYSFIQREVLAWHFIALACSKQDKGLQCPLKQRTQFAILIPHEQSSAALSAECLGRERVNLKSGAVELMKLEFKTDASTWQIWVDERDEYKVLRMAVVGENTIIDRD
jgi:hypothetical protein